MHHIQQQWIEHFPMTEFLKKETKIVFTDTLE